MSQPEIFTNVHKGLRGALFAACSALGRAVDDDSSAAAADALLTEALHFVAHHGDNEDLLLLPSLRTRVPEAYARMQRDHEALTAEREALLATRPAQARYLAACAFTAHYLLHLDDEERVCQPLIAAVLSADEMNAFSRGSRGRTSPADQRMMFGWMVQALPRPRAEALLANVPPELAAELRPLVPANEPRPLALTR